MFVVKNVPHAQERRLAVKAKEKQGHSFERGSHYLPWREKIYIIVQSRVVSDMQEYIDAHPALSNPKYSGVMLLVWLSSKGHILSQKV